MEPVIATEPTFWKWVDQRLNATLGTRPTISIVTRRSGTSQIDQSFWGNLTRVIGISIGEMLQSQQSQQQPTVTPIAQAGRRVFYRDWALAALMGYSQVYTESGIPKIWGDFKFPRNVLTTASNYWQE